ncbi:MAG: S41 family peptidase [Cytophagales bacterium]|nr:S41 family peptidase [Cytophagales bacterium]MDW8384635.1 S41 family peptidase [Flammeovirgaceae bacterium]
MNQQFNSSNHLWQVRLPMLIALVFSIGIFLGYWLGGGGIHIFKSNSIHQNAKKFKEILSYIEEYYVDSVKIEAIASKTFEQLLQQLDPHSSYIDVRDVKLANAALQGEFEGIGVEFLILRDTIEVVAVIAGGPSERAGLLAGDKIVQVDTQNVAGIRITSRQVMDLLRGEKGTKVTVGIIRRNIPEKLFFTITRDKIPTRSVETFYMVDDSIGYLKLSRFTNTSYEEFTEALSTLLNKGMKKLIFDLRNNGGGYLDKAISIADEFLDDDKLIVYTDGKGSRYDEKYYAKTPGDFEKGTLVVLMNEASASASEILAGALQDNDRAIIIGRRSYGKGLVQRPFQLSDGSELRLTISRYYTPSGRCIQKAYSHNIQAYANELEERYHKGEYFDSSAITISDTTVYKTLSGKTVYGGGGIIPDIFVPEDTLFQSRWWQELSSKEIIREFAIQYTNENRKLLESYSLDRFVSQFELDDNVMQNFWQFCVNAGLKISKDELRSQARIHWLLKAFVARNIWKDEGFYKVYHQKDEIYQKALQVLR